MARTKQKAVPAKADPKVKGKTPAPEKEKRDNRYLRAAKIIISLGESEGCDPIYLAMKADMSQSTAGHCIEAFRGVTTALREAKLLPQRPVGGPQAPKPPAARQTPEKAAVAAQKAEEPVPA
jgi:hypothetical protein